MPNPTLLTALAIASCLTMTAAGWAATTVTVTPPSLHPRQAETVSGAGFGASEAVDVYLDTTDTLLLVSTAAGDVTGSVPIPASAAPGIHYLTAVGRRSGSAAQASFTVSTAWAEAGFGAAHLDFNPFENTLSTSTVSSLGLLWTSAMSAGGGTPAVVGGRVYVGTAGAGLSALVATTGAAVWTKMPTETFYGSPAVVGGVVYAGSYRGTVYALTASTGATRWTRALGGSIYSSPVVVGGTVYIGSTNASVYGLQASTGSVVWSYATGGAVVSSPAVVAGLLYVGSDDNALYALNAATGALIWRYTTGGFVESSPAVANGIAYFGSDDAKVYAVRTNGSNSGSLLWTVTTGAPIYGVPAVANGIVYVGSVDGTLYALDARTGAQRWTVQTGAVVRGPIVANGVVYVTSGEGTLYEVDASNGLVLGSAAAGTTYFGSPVVSDGVVYLSASGGNTFAFAPQAGTEGFAARAKRGAPAPSSLHPDLTLRVTAARAPAALAPLPEDGPQ